MADETMAVLAHLRKLGLELDEDWVRTGLAALAQMVMEAEVSQQIGAVKHERNPQRTTQRNGYRRREWHTRVGEIELQIPKLRQGTYYPSLLEPRRRSEKALVAVVQEAYVAGVSTRKVDELVQALGLSGMDRSRVSRLCAELDAQVAAFRERELEGAWPYVWLDALYIKARYNHRVCHRAVVIAIGVNHQGERAILGFAIGNTESEPFWSEFLRALVARGLSGVQLVISDAHLGLTAAVEKVLHEASWQRCRVHFMRNLLAHIPAADKALVAAAVRTIFTQPTRPAAGAQLAEVVESMHDRWPQAAALLAAAEEEILAFMSFPKEHWTRIYSTNPLERLNKELKRRTNVVGIFPSDAAVVRLVGALLVEQHDEWQVARRYFSLASMRQLYEPEPLVPAEPAALRLAPVR